MSYYTANELLYWDGTEVNTSDGVLAFGVNDVVPDATVTRDGLLTLGLVTLQTGAGAPAPEYPVTVIGAPSNGGVPTWNSTDHQWQPGPSPSATYVARVPAPTLSTTVDTAALQDAHDALPSTGGTLWLAPGIYALTATGVTFTKPVRLIGAGYGFMGFTDNGDASNAYHAGGSVLQQNSATAVGITCTISGCTFADLAFDNISVSTPTSGSSIVYTKGTNAHCERVISVNYYDAITLSNGSYYTMRDNLLYDVVRYGYFVENNTNSDSGDGLITGGAVTQTPATSYRAATAAVRWESGGGLKIIGLKTNGVFTNGLDMELDDAASTSNILITGNSVENFTGTGIKCVAQGSGTLKNITITGNEIGAGQGGSSVGIGVGASMKNGIIEGNVFSSLSIGIEDLGGDGWHIGANQFDNVTTHVKVDSTATRTATIRIAPQATDDDNVLVIDNNNSGTPNYAVVDIDDKRVIPSTTGASVTTLWTTGVGNFAGGILECSAEGLVQSGGGFAVEMKRHVTSDGSGNVTLTIPPGWTDGATGAAPPDLTIDTSVAGSFKIKIALDGGTDIDHAEAQMKYRGPITSQRRGS